MSYVFIFNPFNGNFEQVIKPITKQQVVDSLIVATDDESGEVSVMVDEDSVLFVDDDFIL